MTPAESYIIRRYNREDASAGKKFPFSAKTFGHVAEYIFKRSTIDTIFITTLLPMVCTIIAPDIADDILQELRAYLPQNLCVNYINADLTKHKIL